MAYVYLVMDEVIVALCRVKPDVGSGELQKRIIILLKLDFFTSSDPCFCFFYEEVLFPAQSENTPENHVCIPCEPTQSPDLMLL